MFYYHHISLSARAKITDPNSGNFLVSVSSLQSFTEISRQYSNSQQQLDTTSSSARQVQSPNQNSIRTPLTTSATTLTHSQLSHKSTAQTATVTELSVSLRTEKPADSAKTVTPEAKSGKVKSREKSRYGVKTDRLPRVLLLYGPDGYRSSNEVRIFLESHRIPFLQTSLLKARDFLLEKLNGTSTAPQQLRDVSIVVIVAYFHSALMGPYLDLCHSRHLSLIWAILPDSHSQKPKPPAPHLPSASSVLSEMLTGMTLSPNYPFYYGRPGATGGNIPPGINWTIFSLGESGDGHMTRPPSILKLNTSMLDGAGHEGDSDGGYRVLVEVGIRSKTGETGEYSTAAVVLEDKGLRDGVRKILIGTPLRFWLSHLMLLEGVHQLGEGREGLVREGRERMVMVDIDDIFLAPEGRRMTPDDVQVEKEGERKRERERQGGGVRRKEGKQTLLEWVG